MQFELLCQELVHGAEIIRAMTMGITQAEARSKPNPASWSILEVVCHLYDIEREDFRPRLDSILHRPAEEWTPIDPASWVTTQGYNKRDLAETLDRFLAEREKSLAWLKSLSTPNWEAEHIDQFGSIKVGEVSSCLVSEAGVKLASARLGVLPRMRSRASRQRTASRADTLRGRKRTHPQLRI